MALRIGRLKNYEFLLLPAIPDAEITPLPRGADGWQTLEKALLFDQIDAGVFPLEAVPYLRAESIAITALTKRHNPADVLLVKKEKMDATQILKIPFGGNCVVSSQVTAALMQETRPDLQFQIIENETLTEMVSAMLTELTAVVLPEYLAKACPINASDFEKIPLNPREFPPAPGQGAVGILAKKTAIATRLIFKNFHQNAVSACTNVERKIGKIAAESGAVAHAFCEQDGSGNFHCWAAVVLQNGEIRRTRFSSRIHPQIAETICKSIGISDP